jgi:predicted phosphodiesterase
MKFLVVGDPHVKPSDLEEGLRLVDRIVQVAKEREVDSIVLTGDLFHTHSLVHVEVMHFWRNAVAKMAANHSVVVLLGNHDAPHDMRPGVHALAALADIKNVYVVDEPKRIAWFDAVAFVPFMRSNDEFVAAMQALGDVPTVYCHQEFDGCKYDNGFYSKHGVDPEAIPQKLVISGHIHTGQEFGKVWYVGAPRWMTLSDANQDRYIWVIEHGPDGAVIGRTPYATDPACQRIVRVEDTAEAPADPGVFDATNVKVHVDIRGTAAWVEERKPFWRAIGARIRTFVDNGKKVAVRESEGIGAAFVKYLKTYQPRYGTPVEVLETMAKERLRA